MDDNGSDEPTQINPRPPIFDKLNPKTRGYLAQTIRAKQEQEEASHNMANERTFIAIKPDGVQRGLVGDIISKFEKRGYKLAAIKMVTPSKEHLEEHYKDLSEKPFFKGLVTYMLSGPIVAMVWEGRDAVKTGRTLLGATNPLQSAPGTIRGDYAIDVGRNVCHGSDSVETAKNEIDLWFGKGEVIDYKASQFDWIYEKPIHFEVLTTMDTKLEESELLLDSFETSSDALSSQLSSQLVSEAGAVSENIGPSNVSRTSSPDRILNATAGRNSHLSKPAASRRTADPETIRKVKDVVHQIIHSLQRQDEKLFKSQSVVDRYVDILSYTFGVQRAALNVVSHLARYAFGAAQSTYLLVKTATAKGLVAGTFTMTYNDGLTRACDVARDAQLIDSMDDVRSIDVSNVDWILVAKGYPDVSTRAFLQLLSISSNPPLPIYALVDFDPDGIAIMSTYKYGSLTLSHQTANLKTPTVRWLGVKSGDLNLYQSTREPSQDDDNENVKGLLRLSKRDRKKAVNMLGQETYEIDGTEPDWRRELQVMLMLNLKVEMEILSNREGGVSGWVEDKLLEGLMADTARQ
ncbi:MAG: hypothetical protein Q9182_002706 [Xanthomendoza sp. 2 TL-2023]